MVKQKVFVMKKVFFIFLSGIIMAGTALAGVKYTETETVTIVERFYNAPRARNVTPRPCKRKVAEPVRVKTHTEVIDHYQVYQPVTTYKPVGTEIQRRVVPAKTCNKFNF